MLKRLFEVGVVCVVMLAWMSASAMPLGIRTLLHGHAVARQLASEPEPTPEPTPEPMPTPTPEPTPQPTPEPTPDPVTPGYEVIEEKDIVAAYEAPKIVTLQGVAYDGGGAR